MSRFIKGDRDEGEFRRYAIRDTEQNDTSGNGPCDVMLFHDEQDRDRILASVNAGDLSRWLPEWRSDENGGNWYSPPRWEQPDAEQPAEDPELVRLRSEVERLQRELSAAREPITDVNDERLTPIWDKAAEAAEENGFCPEYDKLANSLGIPGRERLYRGVVEVRFNVYAYARSRVADDAADEMEQAVREAVRNLATVNDWEGRSDGDISHVDFNSSEVSDVSVYE